MFWLAYTLLCFHFYLERSTYADNSYYLFKIIEDKSFCVQYARYSAVLTQWLPLLFIKFKLPLKAILFAYTLNPVLLYFFIFLIIRYISTEKWVSYIYMLSLLVTVQDAFFYVNDELNQAAGFLILMVAVLRSEKIDKFSKMIGLLMIILIMQFAHLFLLLAAIIILVVCFVEKKQYEIIIVLGFTLLIVVLRATLFKGGRDGASMDSLDWKFITLRNLHSSQFALFVRKMLLYNYLPTIILMFLLFIKNKVLSLTKIALIVGVCTMYILLVVFLRNGASAVYQDKYLAVLFLIVWSVIAFTIKDKNVSQTKIQIVILLVVIFSFVRIFKETKYTQRIEYLTTLLSKKPIKQIYLYENVPENIQIMSWSVPYETLIMSSLRKETKTILIKEHFYKIDQYLKDANLFLGAEWTFGMPIKLDEYYFPLKATEYQNQY